MPSRPGKIDCPAVRVEELPFNAPAGHYVLIFAKDGRTVERLQCGCPCGCGAHYGAQLMGPDPWGFDGNLEKPTVTGSFGCYPSRGHSDALRDGKFHWHGRLTAGEWVEC